VGDEDDGLGEAAREGAEFALKLGAGDRIERAEGLVHQENGRVGGEGASDADALALTAGKLVRPSRGELGGIEPTRVRSSLTRELVRAASHFSSDGTSAMFSATVKCGNSPAS